MKSYNPLILLICLAFGAKVSANEGLAEKLDMIQLPPGFEISIYAEGVENARQLALGDHGTVFAGSRRAGKVHAVMDADGSLLVPDDKANAIYRISYLAE